MTELAVNSDPSVLAARKALYEAREAQNQIVSWVPEVMVMADAPKPRQTYVLNRGLYNARLDPVDPAPLTDIFSVRPQSAAEPDRSRRPGLSSLTVAAC
jgi:hypothetical protein